MGNAAPKGTNRFDDDDDFGASFVLSRDQVDDALTSGEAPSADIAVAPQWNASASRRKLVYTGAAIAAALLIGGVSLLAL